MGAKAPGASTAVSAANAASFKKVVPPDQVFNLKCGVMANVSFFSQDAASLKADMAKSSADDSESRMGFDTSMGMNDLYSLVCPK